MSVGMGVLEIAVSGLQSASTRIGASAHNVANFTTPDFHPLRSVQTALPAGGSTARNERAPTPEAVDLGREWAEQIRGSLQFRAALRLFAVEAETRGRLVDLSA